MTISRLRPRREFAGVRWLRYMAYSVAEGLMVKRRRGGFAA
jgi:hypothetical protein